MKRIYKFALAVIAVIMLVSIFSISAFAETADPAPSYSYELSIDGQDERYANAGDIITVSLYLNRTDANEDYTMYAMQNEIRYDGNFFEYVEGSELLATGIRTTEIAAEDGYREVYMNFLSLTGGETWKARKLIGSFQLRVISDTGVSRITSRDYLVSFQDGSGSYACTANELTVIVSTDCEVRLEKNNGTAPESITAVYGEKLTRPADPQREGMVFAGWYKDIACTEAWDFDTDTVLGNITLYAKWDDAPDGGEDTDPAPPTDTEDPDSPESGDPETEEPPATEDQENSGYKKWIAILGIFLAAFVIMNIGLMILCSRKGIGPYSKYY